MALSSMTGFARGHGTSGPYGWAWEIKSVNGKGLDLRLRLPPGWDAIEAPVRAAVAEKFARGSLQANLVADRTGAAPSVRVNTAVLEAVLAAMREISGRIESASLANRRTRSALPRRLQLPGSPRWSMLSPACAGTRVLRFRVC